MPTTRSSTQVPSMIPSKHLNAHVRKTATFGDLQHELTRLRAVLARGTMISHLITTEPERFPDMVDQAATEHELNVALSVKLRTFDKLRRIEQALTSLHARSYGICSHCGHAIPSARLKVQPDSFSCVPCLTVIEQQSARN